MIKNFEDITCELTPDEKRLVPVIIRGLNLKSKANPIKGADIVNAINANKERYGIKKFSEPRLRKIINFISSSISILYSTIFRKRSWINRRSYSKRIIKILAKNEFTKRSNVFK